MRSIAGKISRRAKRHIQHFPVRTPIFEELGIEKQINEAFQRQVLLPCGGYLVIDETEALIAIDVNTGRNKGTKDLDKTILDTNLEAAYEIARQLRLRNIGGLVVVDFIDMRHRKDQQAVYKAMKDRLKRDKAKTQVLQITPIGLMEMTRQRLNESLRESVHDPCPYCGGRGRVKSVMTMSVEIQRQIYACIQKYRDTIGDMVIVVNSEVLSRFKTKKEIEAELVKLAEGKLDGAVLAAGIGPGAGADRARLIAQINYLGTVELLTAWRPALAFIDADCVARSDWLYGMVGVLARENVGAVTGGYGGMVIAGFVAAQK